MLYQSFIFSSDINNIKEYLNDVNIDDIKLFMFIPVLVGEQIIQLILKSKISLIY